MLVFFGFFEVISAVFLLESFYSACGIDIFLLARVEWMAHGADFGVDFFCCAAGLEGIPAAAVNYNLIVFWMYPFFHNNSAPKI